MALRKFLYPLPRHCYIAVSGGQDSMAALHFLTKVRNRVKGIIHFNHGSCFFKVGLHKRAEKFSDKAEVFVRKQADKYNLPIEVGYISDMKIPKGESPQAYWSLQRYEFLKRALRVSGNYPIVLAHTLDDVIEGHVMKTYLRGKIKDSIIDPKTWKASLYQLSDNLITYRSPRADIIRPFRTWSREDMKSYCLDNKVSYVDDPMNNDESFKRVFVRNNIIPKLREANPGLDKRMIKLLENFDSFQEKTFYL